MENTVWIPPKTFEEKVRDLIVPDWLRIRERAWRERRKGEKEIKIIPNLLVNCNRAVDIGANVGKYSSYLLENSFAKIIAFEPMTKSFTELNKIKKNYSNRFFIYNIGLGDKKVKKNINMPFMYSLNSSQQIERSTRQKM